MNTANEEEAVRRWLNENNLCAIKWNVINEMAEVYKNHGPKELFFVTDKSTYALRDKIK